MQLKCSILDHPQISSHLTSIKRGIEKECLRVARNAAMVDSLHPKALGSALTHPNITTDYSENLLEFVTNPYSDHKELLDELSLLHKFTQQHLASKNEMLWPASMPPVLSESDIKIAQYGSSPLGQVKHIYRKGLGLRYGKKMQTIAGIHFNFSLPDSFWQFYYTECKSKTSLKEFRSTCYFNLIRNYFRYGWLVVYLFGASVALDKSFLKRLPKNIETFSDTCYSDTAASLRSSSIGYQNKSQAVLPISYNSLSEYVETMYQALNEQNVNFVKFGIKKNGEYLQLNDKTLQIEAEYYNIIRPKYTSSKLHPLKDLKKHGVEYVEIRSLDLNPFVDIGITETQVKFLDIFLLYCLFTNSPAMNNQEYNQCLENYRQVAEFSNGPNLTLKINEQQQTLQAWCDILATDLSQVSEKLNTIFPRNKYNTVMHEVKNLIVDPQKRVSKTMLNKLLPEQIDFTEFHTNGASAFQQQSLNTKIPTEKFEFLTKLAKDSLLEQEKLELTSKVELDTFIKQNVNSIELGR